MQVGRWRRLFCPRRNSRRTRMSDSLRALLIDDERLARRELRKLLAMHDDIAVVDEAATIAEAVASIGRTNPNLIFLDIQLTGESGFDLFQHIEQELDVIFVTAFDQHALRAFEVN